MFSAQRWNDDMMTSINFNSPISESHVAPLEQTGTGGANGSIDIMQ